VGTPIFFFWEYSICFKISVFCLCSVRESILYKGLPQSPFPGLGALDEPKSPKPAQRSCRTSPPSYIGWSQYSGLYDNSTEQAQLTKVRLKLPAQVTFQMKILCIALYKSYLCSQPCQILYLKFKEERTCLSKLQRLLTLVLTLVLLTLKKKLCSA
jgi:hypothetical protein